MIDITKCSELIKRRVLDKTKETRIGFALQQNKLQMANANAATSGIFIKPTKTMYFNLGVFQFTLDRCLLLAKQSFSMTIIP